MKAFTQLKGIAVPFDEPNVDTNQICPTRFNRAPAGPDYHRILFHDRRFNADGSEKPDFILNREPYRRSKVLVSDRNFGCGSSRESAVFALIAFGIECVIAKSFGDIFYGNCQKNGLLPVALDAPIVDELLARLKTNPGAEIFADLEACRVELDGMPAADFKIDDLTREKLLLGLDDIQLTERYGGDLSEFEKDYYKTTPWLRPAT
jgi:3-isopropylmalate/(R)-2-methylmalate dehydratase small subunit